jgi:DNA-binding NarL/FixJ family response regulator
MKIILATENEKFRNRLKNYFKTEPKLEVIAEIENSRETISFPNLCKAQVILMDKNMLEKLGVAAVRQFLKFSSHLRIIILTVLSDQIKSLQFFDDMSEPCLIPKKAEQNNYAVRKKNIA